MLFDSYKTLQTSYYYHAHFIDEETEELGG